MFTDPLAITYDGSAKSLPRVSAGRKGTIYSTADGEFVVSFTDLSTVAGGRNGVQVTLARTLPDPTPADVFNDYRRIVNTFGVIIGFDPTRAEASDNLPKLRTALDSFVSGTVLNRLISGEK